MLPFEEISTLSVYELTLQIKSLLEDEFTGISVQGEISQPKTSTNGHVYFTLKDDRAQLPCVMWSSTARMLNTELLHGQQVTVSGDLQVYPPHGKYQLIVRSVQQAGIGALQKAFEELKNKLASEGLFDESRKKSLPAFPQTIGVITSGTGAAFHDITSTLEHRYPLVTVLLYHASVQGVNAAPEIVKGIQYFSEEKPVDLLIVGRGGGSLEDLWPFNEEAVARAIYACPIPVISAVGHETDFSISDFVADLRAATPTQAALKAVPDANELRFYVDDLARTVKMRVQDRIRLNRERVDRLIGAHALLAVRDKVSHAHDVITTLKLRMSHAQQSRLTNAKIRLNSLEQSLQLHNPIEPLERGFVRVLQDGKWIRKAKNFESGDSFDLQWQDNTIAVKRS